MAAKPLPGPGQLCFACGYRGLNVLRSGQQLCCRCGFTWQPSLGHQGDSERASGERLTWFRNNRWEPKPLRVRLPLHLT